MAESDNLGSNLTIHLRTITESSAQLFAYASQRARGVAVWRIRLPYCTPRHSGACVVAR